MEFSREFGLAANVVEKDYVLGWVLAGIFNRLTNRDRLRERREPLAIDPRLREKETQWIYPSPIHEKSRK